jgi:hypothetical protein
MKQGEANGFGGFAHGGWARKDNDFFLHIASGLVQNPESVGRS